MINTATPTAAAEELPVLDKPAMKKSPAAKKRAAKIGRNIKKNVAVEIPEHYIPAFKPAKEFVSEVKSKHKPG